LAVRANRSQLKNRQESLQEVCRAVAVSERTQRRQFQSEAEIS
jgi:hypothetical protein